MKLRFASNMCTCIYIILFALFTKCTANVNEVLFYLTATQYCLLSSSRKDYQFTRPYYGQLMYCQQGDVNNPLNARIRLIDIDLLNV